VLRSCRIVVGHIRDEVDVLIFDLRGTSNIFDCEVWLLWFFWHRWRWWGNVLLFLLEVSKVLKADVCHTMGSEFLPITHDGHVTRDDTQDDENQDSNNEESLDHNDDNTDDRRWNPGKIELGKEANRESSGCYLAETEHPDSQNGVSPSLERLDANDRDEGDNLPDEKTDNLSSRTIACTTDEASADELINDPEGEEPPTRTSVSSRKPSEALSEVGVLVDTLLLLIVVDEFDLEE